MTLCTHELLCCVSCFITFHWIHGLIFLYRLQDFSFHKLEAPGWVFILQQDHVDRNPIQALTDASTRSSKYPHDTHTQPPMRCSHFQPRGSCLLFLMSNLLKSSWYLQGFSDFPPWSRVQCVFSVAKTPKSEMLVQIPGGGVPRTHWNCILRAVFCKPSHFFSFPLSYSL